MPTSEFDTPLNLTLEVLRRIPKNRDVTILELQQELLNIGIDRTERTLQRLLNMLCEKFDIECNDKSRPYGYRWKERGHAFMAPQMTLHESLLLKLAHQQLKAMLPPNVLKSMDGFFKQADSDLRFSGRGKLEREWLSKVRVVSEMQPLLPPKIATGVFETVSECLFHNFELEICYVNQANREGTHRVKPLGLALQGVRTYLVCQFEDYSNQRILALHRMKSVKNLGIPFVRPKFDLEEYDGEGHFGIGEGQFVKLTFCITKGAGKHILESPLSKDQVVEEMDDHYQITATVVETKLLERWLFGFGKDVWGVVKSK